jgi:outer membrane immunogenic protein
MKRVLMACLGLVVQTILGSPAAAADLPPAAYPPARGVAPLLYSQIDRWTGFYIGINGGWGFGNSQWDGIDKFTVSGGLIGGTLGYNWHFRPVVAGIEGDLGWSGIGGSTNTLCPLGCETRNHWLATARGRLGFAVDQFLPYLTAGLAIGDISAVNPGWPAGSIITAGWTLGAGLEVGVTSNLSLKAEYLFVDLGDFNCGYNCALAGGGNVSFYANILRGGLNVRF